jgi:hypothetical protein
MTRQEMEIREAQLKRELAELTAAQANEPTAAEPHPPPAVTVPEPPQPAPAAEQPGPTPEPKRATAGPVGAPASPAEEFALQWFFARQRSYQGEMERLARAEDHQEGFARALRGSARGRGYGFPFGNRRG